MKKRILIEEGMIAIALLVVQVIMFIFALFGCISNWFIILLPMIVLVGYLVCRIAYFYLRIIVGVIYVAIKNDEN